MVALPWGSLKTKNAGAASPRIDPGVYENPSQWLQD